MKPRVHLSSWKSPEAEQRVRELEDALIDATVVERPEASDVPTHLGATRAYHWPGGGTPVVFLHGATGNGMTWVPYAERRAGRAMYAIDTIGDIGRSHQEVAIEGPDDLVEWLDATLAGLGLREVHL